jgi:hypothetical protein
MACRPTAGIHSGVELKEGCCESPESGREAKWIVSAVKHTLYRPQNGAEGEKNRIMVNPLYQRLKTRLWGFVGRLEGFVQRFGVNGKAQERCYREGGRW